MRAPSTRRSWPLGNVSHAGHAQLLRLTGAGPVALWHPALTIRSWPGCLALRNAWPSPGFPPIHLVPLCTNPTPPPGAGFFIGDGAGVGKGRQIAGVIIDSVARGRKNHAWLSISSDLHLDAQVCVCVCACVHVCACACVCALVCAPCVSCPAAFVVQGKEVARHATCVWPQQPGQPTRRRVSPSTWFSPGFGLAAPATLWHNDTACPPPALLPTS